MISCRAHRDVTHKYGNREFIEHDDVADARSFRFSTDAHNFSIMTPDNASKFPIFAKYPI